MPAPFRSTDTRRRLGLVLALALTPGPAFSSPRVPGEPQPTSDLVLVTVAGLRADRLKSTLDGDPLLPVLGGAAGRGTLIERAWTTVPETLPAATSVMTGLGPGRHGVRSDSTRPVTAPTLARLLAAEKFETRAVIAGAHMQPLRADFARFDLVGDATATEVVDKALHALGSIPAGRRAFVWLHFSDPLPPLQPPLANWLEMIARGRHVAWDFQLPLASDSGRAGTLFAGATNGPLRRAALYLDAYDTVVRSVDEAVGRLVAGLGRDPRHAGALVVLASLHGLGLGDHDHWLSHGSTLYQEELAVPVVLIGPGVRAVRHPGGTISLLDIAPTALARLGMPLPRDRFEGVDLSPMLEGRGPAPERMAFAAQLRPPWRRAALTSGGLKLILTPPPIGSGREGRPAQELYDLGSDPIEAFRTERMRVAVANELTRVVEEMYPALPGTPPAEDESRRR